MWILWWFLWFACGSLPIFDTYPVAGPLDSESERNLLVAQSFRSEWINYIYGLFVIAATTIAIVGCLCCNRHRHPKGFQEFKDGPVSGFNLAFENPVSSLELEVAPTGPQVERVFFEPLPLDCLASRIDNCSTSKPKLPYSAPHTSDHSGSFPIDACAEWFSSSSHVPREKLKYLREIGNGWFGKVVEGRADFESITTKTADFQSNDFASGDFQTCDISRNVIQNKAVIVRILTEEATNKEKSWFLGEATPYLKLRHKNVLSLLGSCLETDPYLLLFEACPFGDLKGFLNSNCDEETRKSLSHGNVPVRMATDVAAGLDHMHAHGLAHTDLAARNCLVTADLTVKIGDYGIGIEKYPNDYYVVGDRALPIRWAAPESFKCTDTTIETLEVTVKANLWSYAVLLWEIVTWGRRPYENLSDEDVIQIVLSSTSGGQHHETKTQSCELLLRCPKDCPDSLSNAMQLCWTINPNKRPELDQVRRALGAQDFEQRWETLQENTQQPSGRSASLLNLHGSMDSDEWLSPHLNGNYEFTNNNDKSRETFSTSFRLGPEEPVKNAPGIRSTLPESGSETEEESWLERVKCGAYTEKVRQKSKSVADLMVLVHIDSDSEAEWSLGMPGSEKSKKRLTSAGSDGNLNGTVLADEFSEALKKFRNPSALSDTPVFDVFQTSHSRDNADVTNVLTLTSDIERRPMLRLTSPVSRLDVVAKPEALFHSEMSKYNDCDNPSTLNDLPEKNDITKSIKKFSEEAKENEDTTKLATNSTPEEHILRLVSKSEPHPPLLRLVPEPSSVTMSPQESHISSISKKTVLKNNEATTSNVSVALDQEFLGERKKEVESLNVANSRDIILQYSSIDDKDDKSEIKLHSALSSNIKNEITPEVADAVATDDASRIKESNKEFPESPGKVQRSPEFHMAIVSEQNPPSESNFLNGEEFEKEMKPGDVDDGKRFSTPDDERSSDSGFRDKESCEEEESPGSVTRRLRIAPLTAEEEQLQVIAELNAVLDSELAEPFDLELLSPDSIERKITDLDDPTVINFEKPFASLPNISSKDGGWFLHPQDTNKVGSSSMNSLNAVQDTTKCLSTNDEFLESPKTTNLSNLGIEGQQFSKQIETPQSEITTEDEMACSSGFQDSGQSGLDDSEVGIDRNGSTESLYSDNSYISFGLDEEYVMAIRKELSEKLPYAQMPVEEDPEPLDEGEFIRGEDNGGAKDSSTAEQQGDQDGWLDEESQSENSSGNVDISIKYNVYNTPLSPILEERESFSIITSESVISKDSGGDEESSKQLESLNHEVDDDVLLVDIATNKAVLVDGEQLAEVDREDQDTFNVDVSDDENFEYRSEEIIEKESKMMGSGSAPLPSPEDELKWQQLSLTFPLPLQDDLMSTSFATKHDWDSQDEENSSSSGEFVWKEGESVSPRLVRLDTEDQLCNNLDLKDIKEEDVGDENQDDVEEDGDAEEDEVEFTPSAWDATLAPHRSALRSPDKTQRQDQKKSVWFKKQRYHCVYEYPKEASTTNSQDPPVTNWEPTSYADWEELMEEPRLDLYSLEYHEGEQNGDEDFYVSSSNRPFQFQTGNGEQVSQFFPGAASALLEQQQHQQLGELRHTRDRLKLNLPPNGTQLTAKAIASPTEEYKKNFMGDLTTVDTDRIVSEGVEMMNPCETDNDVGLKSSGSVRPDDKHIS